MRVREPWEPLFDALVLAGWSCLAAAVLAVSLVVHASTLLGIDPQTKWPGVMFIHVAIFPPFLAAIYCSWRPGRPSGEGQSQAFDRAPRWLRIMSGAFFVYALVNFALFMVLSQGGGVPDQRDGKYVLHSHGKVLRELSEAEYHQQRAYEVRGSASHWMMFACAALTLLWGTASRGREPPGLAVRE